MQIYGSVAQGFAPIEQAFSTAMANDPGGAQLCVYHRGERVVDLWCGDNGYSQPFSFDTITILMSATKAMTATAAHILVERGQLDLNAPVSTYWPEFAVHDKGEIPVAYLLSHKAGLAVFPDGTAAADLLDWKKATEALAGMAPLWVPGSAFMYHSVAFGFLVGEVIRRVSGRSVGQFFAEEIGNPLGLDLWIGLPEQQEGRVSKMFSSLPVGLPKDQQLLMLKKFGIDPTDPFVQRVLGGSFDDQVITNILNSRAGHEAEIPAGNGIGNARSLAKMYAAFIGEVDGVRLLQPATIEAARAPQTDALKSPSPFDRLPMQHPLRFGLGYELSRSGVPMLGEGSFGHTGAGGRLGFVHPESDTAVGFVCNNAAWDYMAGPDARWTPWTNALREILQLG